MNATAARAQAPWHLWAVGLLSLCWNGFGAYDYVMSVSLNAGYLKNYPPEMADMIRSFPVWATSAWALGVWGSVAGSVLLLLRSRHATTAFLISAVAALVTFVFDFTLKLPAELDTTMNQVIPLVILIMIVAQWYYARRMSEAGVLR